MAIWAKRLALAVMAAVALALPSCESGGNFTLFGYNTNANYDLAIHTVRVPIFENRSFYQGLEFQLTRAVVREIETKTPYKVVGSDCNADTELTGLIRSFNKNILLENQLNEIRQGETTLSVEIVWRDLHTGKILSIPTARPADPAAPELPAIAGPAGPVTVAPGVLAPGVASAPTAPTDPVAVVGPPKPGDPALPPAPPKPGPVIVSSVATFAPELGQSTSSARQRNVDRLAVQIVSMMEKPW
jgi:hypothetical protein